MYRGIRIEAPHFVAGVGAPIIKYMNTWSDERIFDYCSQKGWQVSMQIKLTAVGSVTKEKTYYFVPITFIDNGKTKEKKIMSFTDVYETFKSASGGESYNVEVKKDDNGYWQWVAATKASEGAAPAAAGGASRFESPDRQKSIVRQSSLAQAVAFTGPGGDEEEVLRVAGLFEEWVTRD